MTVLLGLLGLPELSLGAPLPGSARRQRLVLELEAFAKAPQQDLVLDVTGASPMTATATATTTAARQEKKLVVDIVEAASIEEAPQVLLKRPRSKAVTLPMWGGPLPEPEAPTISPLPSEPSSFAVCVHGEPIPLHRHMLSRGRMYNPSATQQLNFARACASYLPLPPLEGPLEAELRFFFTRPLNHYRTGKFAGQLRDEALRDGAWHSKRKDLDNLIKFVLDSLNGLAYLDDCQISSIISSKRYAEEGSQARTEVRIRKL